MTNANLYALFQTRFPKDLNAPALVVPDGDTVSYGDLDKMSAQVAGLLSTLGVAKGDRVAVQIDKSPQAVALYLACLRVGAVYLPLNTAYTASEVAYFINDAEPKLLVCRPQAEQALFEVLKQTPNLHIMTCDGHKHGTLWVDVQSAEPWNEIAQVEPDDLAAILYTSGTTGRSKGAMLSHQNLASNALALHDMWGWRDGDVLIHALPIFHVHGLFVALHCALLNGSKMWFMPKFDVDTVIDLLPKATVLMGVPTFYTRLVDHPGLTKEAASNMRLFVSGSAPLLAETFSAFEGKTGHRILERYGMTETGMITSNPLIGDRVPATVGYPLPGVQVRVANENGDVLAPQEIGVLEVIGPNVFSGYWRMPEKTASEFRKDGWFITGDVAKMDEDGRVSIVGRAKDMIISGGFNVYPKEIETVIDELPGVIESAVVGVPHPDFGEAVVAVIVSEPGANITDATIQDAIKDQLARFKHPKGVFIVNELPRNTMGKVQKNILRETYNATFS
ncbi:malonate--CoA ligase [Magnetovibrio blakemorei]|uniref:3-methylmercaptopropionyl-CoA ligase n=1 Tax=Magnetovibrio blakemorei TaxID=28181 RepID=A0A1E5Q6P4_9PROT|nr:malonyl-CoA synthase [Magnetovibrio blakemorei]OEJ66686.1 malonyl-CoA synthase [Magnetovibrio blakemorei]